MFRKLKRYAKDPYYALGYDMIKRCPKLMSDKFYLSVLWKIEMGYKLDWKHPQTFNEKLQWLKLHDHNPLYPTLVDKYRVKQWVADKIGEQHVVPTLAVYNSVEEIDLNKLPDQFVLKCNHDSGSVVICRDKSTFDLAAAKKKLGTALQHNFYWDAREWAYKKVKRVVFAEQYMEDSSTGGSHNDVGSNVGKDLLTYKFMCFDGNPFLMYVTVKNDNVWENYYDMDFNPLDIRRIFPKSDYPIAKPRSFEKMKQVAGTLSKGLKHIRLDLYEVNGEVYFSEYTFYDWGGLFDFHPHEYDIELGKMLQL